MKTLKPVFTTLRVAAFILFACAVSILVAKIVVTEYNLIWNLW